MSRTQLQESGATATSGSGAPTLIMESLDEKLYTNRLLLRRVQKEDLALLVEWSHSRDSSGEFLSPENYDPQQLEQKITAGALWCRREKMFVIEKRDGLPLGTIHYWCPVGKMETAVVAVKIAMPQERGSGYGTEAQKSLLIYLFEKVKVESAEMYIDLDNLPQERCLIKLGFEYIESLTYDDKDVRRVGSLYRINRSQYKTEPIYRYHYE